MCISTIVNYSVSIMFWKKSNPWTNLENVSLLASLFFSFSMGSTWSQNAALITSPSRFTLPTSNPPPRKNEVGSGAHFWSKRSWSVRWTANLPTRRGSVRNKLIRRWPSCESPKCVTHSLNKPLLPPALGMYCADPLSLAGHRFTGPLTMISPRWRWRSSRRTSRRRTR